MNNENKDTIEGVPPENAIEEMQKIVNTIHEKVDKGLVSDATFKAFKDNVKADFDKKDQEAKDKQEELLKRFDEIDKKLNAKALPEGVDIDDEIQRKAMNVYFRKGISGMKADLSPDEFKTLTVEDAEQGGYLAVPPFFEKEIIDIAAREVSPIRQIAKVVTLSKENEYTVPRTTAHGVGSWVKDAGTSSEDTTLTFGELSVPTEECTALYKVKQTLLEDGAFNIESILKEEYAGAFGLLEGTAFVSGTGVGKPEGFLANATIVGAYVASGTAGAVTANGLIDLWGTPKSIYVRNRADAKFLMRRATVVDCIQLVDGQGQYLLGRLGDAPNWQILGHDVIETPDMPAVASNAYSIAFGNFKVGYLIVDKLGMTLIRDPYTSKTTRVVEFLARRRVGGGVRIPEAIYIQKLAAS